VKLLALLTEKSIAVSRVLLTPFMM
jgi:hypothetical protein